MMDFNQYDELPRRTDDSRTLDWEEVKEERLWEAPEEWWNSWGVAEILYRVGIELPSDDLAEQVWDELSAHHDIEGNAVLCGGAAIERDGLTFTVISSGEDGLDSLDYTVNDVLLATVESIEADADWAISEQSREK